MTPGQQGRGAWFDSMELKLYDTLTREKRVFTPLDPANVRMYVCGPTVYDFAHIGNARPVIVFDVLFRLLRHLYGAEHVTYVRNITDVDDKINARAAEEYPGLPLNEAIRKVTEATDRQFHEDVAALGCLPPTVEPRATEHIAEMRDADRAAGRLRQRLCRGRSRAVQRGVDAGLRPAVEAAARRDDRRRPRRGRALQARPDGFRAVEAIEAGRAGLAVAVPASATPGRPGWHIECSAMSDKWLWSEALSKLSASGRAHPHQFDIHGGGIDLVFPHHENEIAQSRSAFHTPAMANFWMHNGFLQVEGEKMSKSLGNFVTIHELLSKKYLADVLRLQMLHDALRQPYGLDEVSSRRRKRRVGRVGRWCCKTADHLSTDKKPNTLIEALADDLNTPNAIFALRDLFARAKREAQTMS